MTGLSPALSSNTYDRRDLWPRLWPTLLVFGALITYGIGLSVTGGERAALGLYFSLDSREWLLMTGLFAGSALFILPGIVLLCLTPVVEGLATRITDRLSVFRDEIRLFIAL